jgi:Transposase IS4
VVLPNLRAKCARYWIPGSNLTVDEIMLKFKGRTTQKVTIPGKPIDQGLKDFALADEGYILSWLSTRPQKNKTFTPEQETVKVEVELPPNKHKKFAYLTNTQTVVTRLLENVLDDYLPKRGFHVYLDNLFVCWRMCMWAKKKGIAVTGTCRKSACGYPPRLTALKVA